ncbi:MAG: family 16 glycoside hydrolase [Gemmataceae bacterium]
MRLALRLLVAQFLCVGMGLCTDARLAFADEDGFVSIFDGKTLKGWDGDPKFWSVKDNAITGQTTKENPTKGNTFIIWKGGETADFELKLEYRIVGNNKQGRANSGIQYRSFKRKGADRWRIGGYQADFETGKTYSGILYGEGFRGILCLRGKKTVLTRDDKGKFRVKAVGKVGDSKEIQSKIKANDWNSYHIIAKGYRFVHKINGVVTAECTDNDEKMRRASGLLALQLHQGPPMTVQFRNIRIKHLKSETSDACEEILADTEVVGEKKSQVKKIVLIAGRPSHGYGAHEHNAGCLLLADGLNKSGLPVQAIVVKDGWPKDTSVFEDAATIVIYADGGGRHPFNSHLEEIDGLMKKGVGLVCIHYGVEVPKGKSGDAFLDWTGGYFETHWSVNPHWTAKYQQFPKHPISRGVKPFRINDEWYYHMRFRKDMKGVTPILTDLPPKSTLNRRDGAHSGNKFVRFAIKKGIPQHTAWASIRSDGGRGFGFTGGHFHWNWGHDQFRKLVLNAIVWTAKVEVPENGVSSKSPSVRELMANQDYRPPNSFNPGRIEEMLDRWNRTTQK